MGSIRIVGFGPGNAEHRTRAAEGAILEADLVVGYGPYLDLIADLTAGRETFASSMTREVERADYAIREAAAGREVAVVASGDACVYGIGGLVLERMTEEESESIPVTIVPGITAAIAASSVLGAPFMNDYLTLSLSDLLTDRRLILKRLRAAGEADLALALYNPRSGRRTELIRSAREILLEYRSGQVPVGIVAHALRSEQSVILTTLALLDKEMERIDMYSLVVIGNSTSIMKGRYIVTPRGYGLKYSARNNG
jgi:precorrin-3B C17-methyltransferase